MKKGSILLVAIFTALVLSACGKKNVITEDASADYKAARSLPALKRAPEASQPSVTQAPVQTQVLAQQTIDDVQPVVKAVTASIDTAKDGIERLNIDGDFESSWVYINEHLKKSNVTVYTRNKSAGLIAIGCGDIDVAEPELVKKGGWTILKTRKRQTVEAEYCGLQGDTRRNSTTFTVVDRLGNPVGGDFANDLFKRIISN